MSNMKWRLEITQSDCGICDLCALACSIKNYGSMNPYISAIKVNHRNSGGLHLRPEGEPGILPCWHCQEPPCLPACTYDAMEIDDHNIVTILDNCTSCMKCVKACEQMHGISSIFISLKKDRKAETKTGRSISKFTIYKCNMCGGEPACVEICPRDAIKFVEY